MSRINKAKQRIIEGVFFDDLIKYYKLDHGDQRMQCPFHGDSNPSLFYDEDRHVFHCFGCHAKGTVVEFYQRMEGLEGRKLGLEETIKEMGQRFHILIPELINQRLKPPTRVVKEAIPVNPSLKLAKKIQQFESVIKQWEDNNKKVVGYYLLDRWAWGLVDTEETYQLLKTLTEGGSYESR